MLNDLLPPLMGGIYFPKGREKIPIFIHIVTVLSYPQMNGGKKIVKNQFESAGYS